MGHSFDIKEPDNDPGVIRQHRQGSLEIDLQPATGAFNRLRKLCQSIRINSRPMVRFSPPLSRSLRGQGLGYGDLNAFAI